MPAWKSALTGSALLAHDLEALTKSGNCKRKPSSQIIGKVSKVNSRVKALASICTTCSICHWWASSSVAAMVLASVGAGVPPPSSSSGPALLPV